MPTFAAAFGCKEGDAMVRSEKKRISMWSGQSLVLCKPEQLEAVKNALSKAGQKPLRADVIMRPENHVALSAEVAETLVDLLDWLEELDDVQEVFHNADLPEVG